MKIGFIGLGKMGGGMIERLLKGGHQIVAFDPIREALKEAEDKGAIAVNSLQDLVNKIQAPRVIWMMVPSGKPTEETITALFSLLGKGDTVIDGGNSFYKDSIKRAETLNSKGIFFLDVGTSGGIWGLTAGYCLMIGGEAEI